MILSIKPSPLKTKRLRVQYQFEDGTEKSYDFGFKTALRFGNTYIDGATSQTRDAYRARHLANPVEKKLIESLTPSPATFAYWILWGPYRNIDDNRRHLNNMLKS